MKKCTKCGRAYSDQVNSCPVCNVVLAPTSNTSPVQPTPEPSPSPMPAPAPKKDNRWVIGGVIGTVIGLLFTNCLDAYWQGVIVGALVVGVLVGLVPFLVGKSKNQSSLGNIGLVSCIVAALIGGAIFAIPVAAVFVAIIILKK